MSDPQLVRDTSGAAVQALLPDSTSVLSVSGSTSRVAMPDSTNLVRIATTIDVYLAFGDGSVTATSSSMLFPAGAEVFNVNKTPWTHVAALMVGATPGPLTATKML
jgi:hypothetical protein